MTVIPLVVASLLVAVADTDARSMGRLGARSFGVFVLLLSTVAALTALVAPAVFDRLSIDALAAASLRADVGDGVALPALPSIADWLVSRQSDCGRGERCDAAAGGVHDCLRAGLGPRCYGNT
jgi:hypothetical protein